LVTDEVNRSEPLGRIRTFDVLLRESRDPLGQARRILFVPFDPWRGAERAQSLRRGGVANPLFTSNCSRFELLGAPDCAQN